MEDVIGKAAEDRNVAPLNEGYIGQTLEEFFEDCTEADDIEKVIVYNTDIDDDDDSIIVDHKPYGEIPENVLNASFSDFDVGGGKVTINASEEAGSAYYDTVQDFLDDYNGDDVEIFDADSEEVIYSGDKSEVPDEVLEKGFASFDTPDYISVNVTDVDDGGQDEVDESKGNPSKIVLSTEEKNVLDDLTEKNKMDDWFVIDDKCNCIRSLDDGNKVQDTAKAVIDVADGTDHIEQFLNEHDLKVFNDLLARCKAEVASRSEKPIKEEAGRKYIKTRNSPVDASDLGDDLKERGIKFSFEDDGVSVDAKDYDAAMEALSELESMVDESKEDDKGIDSKLNEIKKTLADAKIDCDVHYSDDGTDDVKTIVVSIKDPTQKQNAKKALGAKNFDATVDGQGLSVTFQNHNGTWVLESSIKEDVSKKYIIYKDGDSWKGTPEDNYNARIQDARKILDLKAFKSGQEASDYLKKYETPSEKGKWEYEIKECDKPIHESEGPTDSWISFGVSKEGEEEGGSGYWQFGYGDKAAEKAKTAFYALDRNAFKDILTSGKTKVIDGDVNLNFPDKPFKGKVNVEYELNHGDDTIEKKYVSLDLDDKNIKECDSTMNEPNEKSIKEAIMKDGKLDVVYAQKMVDVLKAKKWESKRISDILTNCGLTKEQADSLIGAKPVKEAEEQKKDFDDSAFQNAFYNGDIYIQIGPDKDGKDFYIFQDWDDVRAAQKLLDPSFSEKDENGDENLNTDILDRYTDGNWGFADEWAVCDSCNKVIRTSPDSYSWVPDYYFDEDEGGEICGDCVRENPSAYVDALVNNPDKANTILDDEALKKAGLSKVGEDAYQNGWYDQHDDPKEILKKALAEHPEGQFIFSISGQGQFATDFELWERNVKDDGAKPVEEAKDAKKDDVEYFGCKNQYNYDKWQLRVDHPKKEFATGQFVMMSKSRIRTEKALKAMIDDLKEKGYKDVTKGDGRIVGVNEAVGRTEYCIMDKLGNNIDCDSDKDSAIKKAASDGKACCVKEVKYGPQDANKDETELSAETIWSKEEKSECASEGKAVKESRGRDYPRNYRGCHRIDAGDVFVITNENGDHIGETKWGGDIWHGIVDDYRKDHPYKGDEGADKESVEEGKSPWDDAYEKASEYDDSVFRKHGHPEKVGQALTGEEDMSDWTDDERKQHDALVSAARSEKEKALSECDIKEDTVRRGGKWMNKGKEGTHGKFATKKAADAQRKAMFANGFKESLDDNDEEEIGDDEECIYLFPGYEMTAKDKRAFKEYGLKFLGRVYDGEYENWAVKGTKADLKAYCDDWIGIYELAKGYLYRADDFDTDSLV